jgi:hypothetical protein
MQRNLHWKQTTPPQEILNTPPLGQEVKPSRNGKMKSEASNRTVRAFMIFLLFNANFLIHPFLSESGSPENNMSKCPYDDMEKARNTHIREIANLSPAGGRALRNGLRLELQTRDRLVVLEDDCSAGESSIRYFFASYSADIGYFHVKASLYEGRAFLLVNDKSGEITWLKAPPVISSDKKRFVTMSMDLEAGYHPNEIKVWRLEASGPELEYSANFGEKWGPSDPVWKDGDTIAFQKNILDPKSPGKLISAPATLKRKGETWEIHLPSS